MKKPENKRRALNLSVSKKDYSEYEQYKKETGESYSSIFRSAMRKVMKQCKQNKN